MSSYNSEMNDKFDDKVCVNEAVISAESIKEELCDLGNEQGSIHSYYNIKGEDINDSTIVTQDTELMKNSTGDKVCVNETVLSNGSIKEEPYDWENKQESIRSCLSIKDENIDDLTVVTKEIELITDYIDDKICEMIISNGIKEEPRDLGSEQGSIHSYISIKDEDIDDLTVVRPDTEFISDFTDDKVCANETISRATSIKAEPCDLGNEHNYVSIKDENIDDLAVITQETELTNDCAYNKVCINKTIFVHEFIKEEPSDLRTEQGSIHTYINTKDENIDDLMVITQDTKVVNDCTEDKVCVNKPVISGGSITEEPCDLGNEHSYINIENKTQTVVTRETELMTDCTDDKVCVNDTIISGYIKQKPYDMEDDQGHIRNYVKIKDENIDELIFIVVQETEPIANLEVNYLICCEACGEEYDLYCRKCPMLFRIIDSSNPDGKYNTVKRTLPKNFIDICGTPSGVGIVALRSIPEGVVFGPFKGLDSIKEGRVSKWKLRNRELVYMKGPKWLNWMQYVRLADRRSHPNLTPFQYKGELYYRSDRQIGMGDKLIVCRDSDCKESGIQNIEDSYWEPPVCENLDSSYACTHCCVGYKSISHLNAHNSICPEKRNQDDYCKEIVQCYICKIYLDMKEYVDYHMDRCNNTNKKSAFKMCYRRNRQRPLNYHVDTKPMKCETCDIEFWNTRLYIHHQKEVHAPLDKTFSCFKCKYRTRFEYAFSKHLVREHDDPKVFACVLCQYKTTKQSNLKQHVAIHCDDKPFACNLCPYKAKKNSNLKRHMTVHSRPPSLRRNYQQKAISNNTLCLS